MAADFKGVEGEEDLTVKGEEDLTVSSWLWHRSHAFFLDKSQNLKSGHSGVQLCLSFGRIDKFLTLSTGEKNASTAEKEEGRGCHDNGC